MGQVALIIGALLGGAGLTSLTPLVRAKAQNRRDDAAVFTLVADKVQEIAGVALDRMEKQLDDVLAREAQCRRDLDDAHAKIGLLNDDVLGLRSKVAQLGAASGGD